MPISLATAMLEWLPLLCLLQCPAAASWFLSSQHKESLLVMEFKVNEQVFSDPAAGEEKGLFNQI